jgi:ABC-type glucose/galactose transport system permease subunit
METIIGLIPNNKDVLTARQELEKAGFAKNKINILFQPADVWQRLEGRQKIRIVFKDAVIGMFIGLFVGAIYGIPAGYYNCRFMNCPLETSIILWAIVSLFWAVAGGFLGAIVGLDRFEADFYSYVEGVQRGEALFVVEASEKQATVVKRILEQEHGILVHDLEAE